MAIELDKILTVSVDEYVRSMHKDISEYELVGVHASVERLYADGFKDGIDSFRKEVPTGAEVVASLKYGGLIGSNYNSDLLAMISGTALIPKKEMYKGFRKVV